VLELAIGDCLADAVVGPSHSCSGVASDPTVSRLIAARSQPAFPMMPGMREKRTHDYVRHGTTSLFAAFNVAVGTVISSLHRRHRSTGFKKFLAKIDGEVPDDLDVHLVCDNYGTHKHPTVSKWLAAHPRFHMHFTPTYSSSINQVERFFAFHDRRSAGPQRPPLGTGPRERHPGPGESLEREPQAFHLDQISRRDPDLTRTTYPTNYRRGTLGVRIGQQLPVRVCLR
jgi:hypothetical protein